MTNAIEFQMTDSAVNMFKVRGDFMVLTLDGGFEIEADTIEEAARVISHFGESSLGIMVMSGTEEFAQVKTLVEETV